MKVDELIKILQKCEPKQEVTISMSTTEGNDDGFRIFGDICEINELNKNLDEVTLICDGEPNHPFTVNFNRNLLVVEKRQIAKLLQSSKIFINFKIICIGESICGESYENIIIILPHNRSFEWREKMHTWINEALKTRLKPDGKYIEL